MENMAQPYKMTNKSRGIALILSMRTTQQGQRDYAKFDEAKLFTAFSEIGFTVRRECDLRKQDIITTLKNVSKENHKDHDCFVCCMLSCGDYGVIEGTDGPVQVDEFLEFFKGDVCSDLAGKPKIFIFQACNPILYKKETTDSETSTDAAINTYTIPSEADFLMVWSLVPGILTDAEKDKGCAFITSFCKRLEAGRGKDEINRILTRALLDTNNQLEKCAPMTFKKANYRLPCVINMLTKPLYLFSDI